jgi:dephospho-CoA kinase
MNSNPMIIGLTGGIASGKSSVADHFKALNIPIIDTDTIARSLFERNSAHLKSLKILFSKNFVFKNGELDRRALAHYVFSHPKALHRLNQFMHPLILKQAKKDLAECCAQSNKAPYVLIDVPLLIKKGGELSDFRLLIHRILVVYTKTKLQEQRAIQRDKRSLKQIQSIIAQQASFNEQQLWGDEFIENSSTQKALQTQVKKLHYRYIHMTNTESLEEKNKKG